MSPTVGTPMGSECVFQGWGRGGPAPYLLGASSKVNLRSLPLHDLPQQQGWGGAVGGVVAKGVPEPLGGADREPRSPGGLSLKLTPVSVCCLLYLSRLSEP